jgi:hypothetical protein
MCATADGNFTFREASVSQLKKRHEFVSAVALLAAYAFSTSCTAWHTVPLQPERFSADSSPERARLTLKDGTEMTARHPVLVGDSLLWVNRSGKSPRDSTRSAVHASNIRKVETHGYDNPRTIALMVFVGGVVAGLVAIGNAIAAGID